MVSIELQNIRMEAFHGVYQEEQQLGNLYTINLQVIYDEDNIAFDSLDKTVDYEQLYAIVKQQMLIATPLLEKVCDNIIRQVKHRFPFTTAIKISLYKLNAAIENFEGVAGVTMDKKFDD